MYILIKGLLKEPYDQDVHCLQHLSITVGILAIALKELRVTDLLQIHAFCAITILVMFSAGNGDPCG